MPRSDDKNNVRLQSVENEGLHVKRRKTTASVVKPSNEIRQWQITRPLWEQELGDASRQELDIGQRNWATINPHPITPTMAQPLVIEMNSTGTEAFSTLENTENSINWSSVNQQPQSLQPPPSSGPVLSVTSTSSTCTTSNTKSNFEKNTGVRFHPDASLRKSTVPTQAEEISLPLIDTLPKGKQRQVYGLVSGIQGGLDHLQRELNSLKRALGINDED